jgi:signal peptidase I
MKTLLDYPPFSWWRLRRARKHAREVLHHVRRLLGTHRDLMEPDKVAAAEEAIREFAAARRGSIGGIAQAIEKLDRVCGKLFPSSRHPRLRETIEIALVAAVVAWGGIRTFFLQPFKIPTGSMQPTLYGVHMERLGPDDKVPALPLRVLAKVFLGQGYLDIRCKEDGELSDIRSLPMGFGLFAHTGCILTVGEHHYTVPAEPDKLTREMDLREGMRFKAGDPIVRCIIRNGDHIFVDKVTYNFRRPRRGEVFVFETKGIEGTRGEFYIKRLAGVGGDTLQIQAPKLFINGRVASEHGFSRVMSCKDGYSGYTNSERGFGPFGGQYLTAPEQTFIVAKNHYFALGDNSAHSADSRFWGPVPHGNLVGRAFFAYWPFSRRFGLTD